MKTVAMIRPNKAEVSRLRLMAGGDKLDYPGITATDVASLTTTKIHLNSVVSTPGTKYVIADIKYFYYGKPLNRFEYLQVQLNMVPEEIQHQYALHMLVNGGWVYIEVRKGMPGLKEAGKVANDRLTKHLSAYRYAPVP